MRIHNDNLLSVDETTVSSSLAASANYKPVSLAHAVSYSIQLVYTGTPAGAFKLQASNDVGQPQASGEAAKYAGVSNWTDIADTSVTISAAGNTLWNVENAAYLWVRVVWTASGAGTTPLLTSARAYTKGI